tara:strand:- start:625 stop:1020 length:396 start_codon:yes stop_codon:yes gene_type:complete
MKKDTTYTSKEIEVMNILATSSGGKFLTDDGVEPNPDGFFVISGPKEAVAEDWGKTGLDLTIYRGVISSLIKKDAITTDSWTWDINYTTGKLNEVTAIALTLDGWFALKARDSEAVKMSMAEIYDFICIDA